MKVTAHQVICNAELTAREAMNRLAEDETLLHINGYRAWSTAMANMRNKFEKALMELVEEVGE